MSEFQHQSWLWFRNREIMRTGMAPQPTDRFFGDLAAAAAGACEFELKIRLFADNIPTLQQHKEEKLEGLVKLFIEHERADLVPEDGVLLKKCVRLRNKLLHADFSSAAGTLISFGATLSQGKIVMWNLDDEASLDEDSMRQVTETSTTTGGVFAWIMECSLSGAFAQARRLFMFGIAFINWRLAVASGEVTETWTSIRALSAEP